MSRETRQGAKRAKAGNPPAERGGARGPWAHVAARNGGGGTKAEIAGERSAPP